VEHTLRVESEALIIAFRGDVDLEHSPKAREVLLEGIAHGKSIFVDLSGVTYIDSSGVASLVEAFQRAKGQGSEFALVAVNPAALRVFQLARLDKVFVIRDSLPEGLAGSV
jgi:anti-sigma B factor antagonist